MSTPPNANTPPSNPSPVDPLQERYYALIDRLLACPNGEEPNVLNAEPELLTPGFVQALMQTASYFAHQNNSDAAKFLIFVARELSHQLGLYPDPKSGENVSPDLVAETSSKSSARPGVL